MAKLHFVMLPLMAPGHIIPMIDMANLLAKRGVQVTIIVTSLCAARFSSVINRAAANGLAIRLQPVRFPCEESGLPPGCESFDALPSFDLVKNFFDAIRRLQQLVEEILTELDPFPTCLFSDKYITWTAETCKNLGIPRIIFDGMNCFTQLVVHNLYLSRIHETVDPTEAFVVPGLPDEIELTKLQLPGLFNPSNEEWTDLRDQVRKTESQAYGVVVNSFEELEQRYVDGYKKVQGGKVWCIGPLSLYSEADPISDRALRGDNQAGNNSECLKWLDGMDPGSVIYVCLGSLTRISRPQFVELALGLEDSNHPFLLVVKGGSNAGEIEEWILDNGVEERTKGRGLFIRGWAPQVLILSHESVGAFLTHCGWNSTVEGICAGLPMVTWPMFAEQFLNEKLVVQILETGVRVGAKAVVHLKDVEKKDVQVSRAGIAAAVRQAMEGGEEGRRRRRRAREVGEKARAAVEEGGSSCRNIAGVIEEIERVAHE